MSRVKLIPRKHYDFGHRLTVEIVHVNFAGHVGHDAIIAMVWQARVHMLRALGASEMDLGDGRTGVTMADLAVNYTNEVFLFEEVKIETVLGDMTSVSFRLFHRVLAGDRQVALVEAGFVAFDYGTHRPAPLPDIFIRAIGEKDRGKKRTGAMEQDR